MAQDADDTLHLAQVMQKLHVAQVMQELHLKLAQA